MSDVCPQGHPREPGRRCRVCRRKMDARRNAEGRARRIGGFITADEIRSAIDPDRFWERLAAAPNGCWEWKGHIHGQGYGQVRLGPLRTTTYAHRVAWALIGGELYPEFPLDHLCRNKKCANPEHLEQVTHRINILRGTAPAAVNAKKDRCHRGHPFDVKNTYISRDGKRQCRVCIRDRQRERRARLAGAS